MAAYYNEFDPYAAQWLRNLISAGHIAPGDVDERSIVDVSPSDLKGYTQCHFFAGIGGWSYALRLAGWPDDRPVWTGSCPCQPFSTAGKGKAQSDERHLWPHWERLIRESKPSIIFGEQVKNAITAGWLDDVFHGLEAEDYACAAAVLPACSVNAPHQRDRVWFVAHAEGLHDRGNPRKFCDENGRSIGELRSEFGGSSSIPEILADTNSGRRRPDITGGNNSAGKDTRRSKANSMPGTIYNECGKENMAYPDNGDEQRIIGGGNDEKNRKEQSERSAGLCYGEGQHCGWEIEPNVGRVANGIPARAHKLRAYGNAIVPQVAAEFIKASWECIA